MRAPIERLETRRLFNGLPTISIGNAAVPEGNVGDSTAAVVVTLSEARPKQSISVNYATQDASAVNGVQYRKASGQLTFAPGQTSKTILVPVIGNRTAGPNTAFYVNLSSAKGGKIGIGQGTVSITDDEPRVWIGTSATTNEGNSGTVPLTFTVSLTSAYDQTVTVDLATADGTATAGSDYVALPRTTLTFLPGQPTTQQVAVSINGDTVLEPDENFSVVLSNPSANTAISSGTATGYILNDEAQIYISDAWHYTGDLSPLGFTVYLSAPATQTVTVDFRTVNGTAIAGQDFEFTSGTLTFAPGETQKYIVVNVLPGAAADDYHYFTVQLSNASAAAPIADGEGTGYWYTDYGWNNYGYGYFDPYGYWW
jgi:hypothetical protein